MCTVFIGVSGNASSEAGGNGLPVNSADPSAKQTCAACASDGCEADSGALDACRTASERVDERARLTSVMTFAADCGGGRLRARNAGYGVQPHPSFAGATTRASRAPQQKPYVAGDVMLRDGPAHGD